MNGQLESIASARLKDAVAILREQARSVALGAGGAELALVIGVLLALYSASKGMRRLMEGMNIAYDREEKRGFIALNLTALALALFLIFGLLVALGSTLAVPALLGSLGLSGGVIILVTWLWLSAFVAPMGPELNPEIKHQIRRDIIGDPRPMGRRGAAKTTLGRGAG